MIPTTCPECKATYEVKLKKYPSRGYPFEIDGEDRAKVIAEQIMQKRQFGQGKSAVNSVRIMLWILAALNLIFAFYVK